MFKSLLSLYQKESKAGRTPLEDFVTEIFAKILERNKNFQKRFTRYLGLPDDDYLVETQKKYLALNEGACIIDIVLKGERTGTLCFFESKVNSGEGDNQLSKYLNVLNDIISNDTNFQVPRRLMLVYCTKNYDPKENSQEPALVQLRWYELYNMLVPFEEDTYVNDFLKLLEAKGMSQRMVFSAEDFLVYKNIQDSMNLLREHLDKSKLHFAKSFNEGKPPTNGLKLKEVFSQNKVFYRYERVLSGQGYSDLKFGFDFTLPSIFVDIWVDRANHNLDKLERIANQNGLSVLKMDNGMVIFLSREISDLLNSKEAELIIGNWFKEHFKIFRSYIENAANEQIKWNDK